MLDHSNVLDFALGPQDQFWISYKSPKGRTFLTSEDLIDDLGLESSGTLKRLALGGDYNFWAVTEDGSGQQSASWDVGSSELEEAISSLSEPSSLGDIKFLALGNRDSYAYGTTGRSSLSWSGLHPPLATLLRGAKRDGLQVSNVVLCSDHADRWFVEFENASVNYNLPGFDSTALSLHTSPDASLRGTGATVVQRPVMANALAASASLSVLKPNDPAYRDIIATVVIRADDYSKNPDGSGSSLRALVVCNVVLGNAFYITRTNESLKGPPTGYDSVFGEVGDDLNYDEQTAKSSGHTKDFSPYGAEMDTNSLIQSDSQSAALEAAEELPGTLEIPADPVISTGFADIYHGFWTSLQGVRVEVAVKQFKNLVPRIRQTEQEELKKKKETRIKREVFVWSQITHPNLQPLLGYRLEPQPQLISPWRRHGNLEEYLRENPDLSRYDKLQIIHQAGRGLEYLHSRTPPICHADIKPENVLITDSRGTALSDFGLSRVLQDLEISGGFTTTETVKGTVRYMASELFAGQKANLEADVYAFGGLILTVMSGRPPFDGLLYHVILRRVMQNELPIPKDHPKLPAYDPLWKLMRRCWDKTPAARPGMLEVLRELETDISYGSTTGNRISEAVLLAAREMLKTLQIDSLVIPVLGKYIVAAAEVGLNLVEIVQTLNRNENTANNFEFNPLELANLLKGLVERSKQPRGDDILACVKDIEKWVRSPPSNSTLPKPP
ncbi:hypothetical protein FRC04_006969 [Tulasnella sp. 424]|nr:hypothetical protein FRC04_006969 [Tulasnella sp. 424]KAG8966047.1 hypothetical protein FRC05_002888 [Tulasnella sp. 425]